MTTNKRPIKFVVVDAFAESEFKGNPAAVCLLEEEREEKWLQSVATEFNLSVTCYLTRNSDNDSPNPWFQLRWFTPVIEVDLCGHATLAAAHFCYTHGLVNGNTIKFSTLSGILTAHKVFEPHCEEGEVNQPFLIELDLPARSCTDNDSIDASLISKALGDAPLIDLKVTAGDDLLVVLQSAQAVLDVRPQFDEVKDVTKKYACSGMIVTAVAPEGSKYDFYSRCFFPELGANEDPVTGSAHCALAVYWNEKLAKCDFLALQASSRTGILKLHLDEKANRVKLQGKAVTVMEGSVIV